MLLVVAGAGGYWLYQRLDGNIQAAGIDNKIGGDRPANLSPGAMNILVVGSDSRDGDNAEYGKGLTTMQADTLMVLHIAANRKWAAVVSLPRDSWVQIPACDRGNGTAHTRASALDTPKRSGPTFRGRSRLESTSVRRRLRATISRSWPGDRAAARVRPCCVASRAWVMSRPGESAPESVQFSVSNQRPSPERRFSTRTS
ncbi:LCP family protein [Streptomyces sp. NPDC059165]|uniref:LCP family protein n=1 Tax=Streptomyces sp. NPDC059165 TaxID=3346751 RepID=UPI00368BF18F